MDAHIQRLRRNQIQVGPMPGSERIHRRGAAAETRVKITKRQVEVALFVLKWKSNLTSKNLLSLLDECLHNGSHPNDESDRDYAERMRSLEARRERRLATSTSNDRDFKTLEEFQKEWQKAGSPPTISERQEASEILLAGIKVLKKHGYDIAYERKACWNIIVRDGLNFLDIFLRASVWAGILGLLIFFVWKYNFNIET